LYGDIHNSSRSKDAMTREAKRRGVSIFASGKLFGLFSTAHFLEKQKIYHEYHEFANISNVFWLKI